ncbi:Pyroglutamyl-peptidase 1 [Podospora aff. communis PSN243]|uniref:Pyroglutamyl-peptidase 1 n=1 Tax=Podospora aff. communis PSN243 TaxID=3040156 RepID=A0AAV9GUC4_9PEZI|nr:Pyroglutamyl-peptidase 1 [Podospora aff. communis PSN243]
MGSTWADSSQEELTVLITGFAPFKKEYPVNPSWEIARSLPEYLPPLRAKTVPPSEGTPLLPPVRLLVHPEPICVNYQTVRSLVPKLWHLDGGNDSEDGSQPKPKKIDLAIHIGMAGPRLFYSIERRGHRDGYNMRDVDGELLGDDERRVRQGKDWVWDGMPAELLSDLDMEDVLERWRRYSPPGSDLRISEDAGRYLCDFIYFSSLSHLYRAGKPRKVVFFHVPSENSEKNFTLGRELVIQLVRSMVESELARKVTQPEGG